MFIALEGIDGSGKSTQIKLLEQYFIKQGKAVYTTAQPTGSNIGKLIRQAFKQEINLQEETIAALFTADRVEHILNTTDGILKKLSEGFTVLCDRYYFSSYAYHSVHVPMDWVIHLNAMAAKLCKPTATIFIDVEPAVTMQRLQATREHLEIYETTENQQKVKANYFKAFDLLQHDERIIIINGNQKPEQIFEDIVKQIEILTPSPTY